MTVTEDLLETETEGIRVDRGELILDSGLWKVRQNVEIEGLSGIKHLISYYGESLAGTKLIMLESDCTYQSLLRAIGTLHVMRMDLGSSHAFVLCNEFSELWKMNLDLSRTDVKIIKSIRLNGSGHLDGKRILRANAENFPGFSSKFKRDRTAIMADIMQLLSRDNQGITSIIYRCNLNYKSATKVLDELIARKYVEMKKDQEMKTSYEITSEGMDALKMIKRFYEIK
ncbi:MAG: winged helix-turn-helix domain-containing protein [Thermoplasmataceae archaeon]|jgi:predicted transcriptional regulator